MVQSSHTSPDPTYMQRKFLSQKTINNRLPLEYTTGHKVHKRTMQSCIDRGWCYPIYYEGRIEFCKLTKIGSGIFK